MSRLSYGLDFGTTNSTIAIVRGGKVQILPIGENNSSIVKSVLYFRPKSQRALIGNEAILSYANHGLVGRFIKSFKSTLSIENFRGTAINGKYFTIEDLVAIFLSHIKDRADQFTGEDVVSVTLGRPAVYSTSSSEEKLARERLVTAAKMAGFERINFQLEPIAAAYKYGQSISSPEMVLIIDLGGGTSDFTLIRLSPGDIANASVLALKGVYVGGDNLDSNMMLFDLARHFGSNAKYETKPGQWLAMPNRLITNISDWRTIPYIKSNRREIDFIRRVISTADDKKSLFCLLALIEEDLGFGLFQEIERVKLVLSIGNQENFHFSRSVVNIEEQITSNRFNQAIQDSLSTIESCISDLLVEAECGVSKIDSVVLTGGTSRVPAIIQMVEKMFGRSKIKCDNTFIDVAAGLALFSVL